MKSLSTIACFKIVLSAVATAAAVSGVGDFAGAASYYFSAAGNDATGDGSQARPWRSIARFNTLDLNPGDSALFRAGDQFTGKMYLDASDGGTNANGALVAPVRIGSYGGSGAVTRAKITSPYNSEAFVAYNAGGIELSNLEFTSGGFAEAKRTNGVQFLSAATASASLKNLQHVRVSNVSAHGFGLNGLQVWAHANVGFDDVNVADSDFYGNGYAGVYVGATNHVGGVAGSTQFHSRVVVERTTAHNNPGFFSTTMPITGHGIVVGNVNGAVVQDSVAYDNGQTNGHGNIGIWTYQANAVTIQRNVAYGNRSPKGMDGGGFDIDGGVTNSVMQYNRSFNNDGAGLLLAQFDGADSMGQNVIRYNLSVNDGKDKYGGITVWGANPNEVAESAVFHNNTIVSDRMAASGVRGSVWFLGNNHRDLDFINNEFVALGGAALIAGDTSAAKSTFLENGYWTGGLRPILEDTTYASVQSWAAFNAQEKGAKGFAGVTTNPKLSTDGSYRPTAGSSLLDAGLMPGGAPWPSWLTTLGSRDLAGNPLNQGAAPDIGAFEHLVADLNYDGRVDAADLAVLKPTVATKPGTTTIAIGKTATNTNSLLLSRKVGIAGFITTVPEPTAGVLAAIAAFGAGAFRSRRRRIV